jgi:hypothetical protein
VSALHGDDANDLTSGSVGKLEALVFQESVIAEMSSSTLAAIRHVVPRLSDNHLNTSIAPFRGINVGGIERNP